MTTEIRDAQDRVRNYPCERCGSDLAFEPGAPELACAYCGTRVALTLDENWEIRERDLEAVLAEQAEARAEERPPSSEDLEVCCPTCSATVVFRGTLTAQSCAYCAAPIQRTDVHRAADRIAVDGVLPFRIEREDARAAVGRWLGSLWFAPNSFVSKRAPERAQSLYLPYWTFDALTSTRYWGSRRKRKAMVWKKRYGSFQRAFDDVAIVADRSFQDRKARRLGPWPLHEVIAYRPECITGHLAKTYDIDLAEGWKRARQQMESEIRREILDRIGGEERRIDEQQTRWDALTYKHLLLPVFVLSIRHRDRIHRVVVNGATGEVIGGRPWSIAKLAVAGAAALALFTLVKHGL